MCGICGIVALDRSRKVDPHLVDAMSDALGHRGPDDRGRYVDGHVALGHRRLSIIDLATGQQPIGNEDGTVWIVFNGEIYNYRELRVDLVARGHRFQTQSDTEVIVHLYEEHGVDGVSRLRGMFAFAIWDKSADLLFLARDRVGIKPLYFAVTEGLLLFASEVKAILQHPSAPRQVSPTAIDAFLMHGYCPGEDTAFAGIRRLLPGHCLLLKGGRPSIRRYWSLQFPSTLHRGSQAQVTAELDALLRDAVREHMISDVPVGVLLSGGVDSTAMLSLATEQTGERLRTFTVGFSDPDVVDERPFARLAAERYGSEHFELTLSATEFRDFLPRYVRHMEEPVCEPPAVALYHVCDLARRHVKVLLSGEGGDEAFAGYQTYRNMLWLERLKGLGVLPASAAATAFALLGRVCGSPRWRKFAHAMRHELPEYYWSRTSGPLGVLPAAKPHLYTGAFQRELAATADGNYLAELFEDVRGTAALSQAMYVDTKTWLPDDLLIKADKMTMAASVELRVPLLDHRILEFAAALPVNMKVRGLCTKYILKRALSDRVPAAILQRRKTGFPVPYGRWLRGGLRGFVRDLLADRRTRERGYFETRAVDALLGRFERGEDLSAEVFSLLTLELWHREFIDSAPVAAQVMRRAGERV